MSVTNSRPAIQQKMVSIPNKSDPLPRVEKRASIAELKGTDRILNNGETLYMTGGSTLIFDPTKTPEQIESEQISENPYGIEAQVNHAGFFAYDTWNDYEDSCLVQFGDDLDDFYIDDGASCTFPQGGTGASFEEEALLADAQSDEPTTPEQQAFLDANTTEPQGELTTAFSAAADPDPVVQPAPAIAANNPTYQAPAMSA